MMSISKENVEEIEENQVFYHKLKFFVKITCIKIILKSVQQKRDVLNKVGENYIEVGDCEVEIVENLVQDLDETKSGDCKSHVDCSAYKAKIMTF